MDGDHEAARLIVSRGLLDATLVGQALQAPQRAPGQDLIAFLQAHGRLQPGDAAALRAQLGSPQTSGSAPIAPSYASASQPSAAPPSGAPPSAPGAGVGRAAAVAAYEQVAAADPLFAPHVERALSRGELLGEGGMGQVFRVTDARLGRSAAFKMLHEGAHAGTVARFVREARITARLDHPAIPPVYEAGRGPGGQHYMLMRVIEGETLSKVLRRFAAKGYPDAELPALIDIFRKVCEGVGYAHSQGIVHRDLKPSNVMVGAFGEVLVMDWGIARDLNEDEAEAEAAEEVLSRSVAEAQPGQTGTRLTQDGAMLGTLGYMPPEQAEGRDVGPRSDIFALGSVLLEMLTGSPAFEGQSLHALVEQTVTNRPPPARERRKGVPRELEAIAAWALEPDPEARPESIEAWLAELDAWRAGRPLTILRAGPLRRLQLAIRRRPGRTLALTGLVVGAACAVAAGLAWKGRRDTQRAVAALAEAQGALREGAGAEAIRRRVDEALALADGAASVVVAGAALLMEAGQLEAAWELLEAEQRARPPAYEALALLEEVERRRGFQGPGLSSPWLAELARRAGERGDAPPTVTLFEALAAWRGARGSGELAAALPKMDAAVAAAPGSWVARHNRGLLKLELGQQEAALADFDAAVAASPRAVSSLLERGRVRAQRGEVDAALEDLGAASALDPLDHEAHLARADLLFDLERTTEAEASYDEASRTLQRQRERLEATRARVEAVPGLPSRAEDFARGFAWLRRNEAIILASRSRIPLRRGDREAARADLERALKVDPDCAAAHGNLAVMAYQEDEDAAAIRHADRCLALAPEVFPRVWGIRGEARLRTLEAEDDEAGFADLARFAELAPEKAARVAATRAYYLRKLQRLDEAEEAYAEAIAVDASFPDSYEGRGDMRREAGQAAAAIADYSEAIRLAPTAQRLTKRADVELAQGQLEAALADYEAAIRLDPRYAPAYGNRGQALADARRLGEALVDWEMFLRLAPDDPAAGVIRGNVEILRRRLSGG